MEETKAVSEEEKESSGVSFLFPELTAQAVAFFYVLMTPYPPVESEVRDCFVVLLEHNKWRHLPYNVL